MEAKITKEKLKKAAIIILPVVFALVASLAVALMVGGGLKPAEEGTLPPETPPMSGESDVQVVAPVESEPKELFSLGLEYRSNGDGTSAVSGIGKCTDRCVIIPGISPEGEVVTAIGHEAFRGVTAIGEVVIPDSVMTIGDGAFRGSGIMSVNLGGSVISIGEKAFAECLSLTAINVSGANAMYASEEGVLFDREMTSIICYPSGRANRSYTIPISVERIDAMAFSSCKNLREIAYEGTEKQWKNVYVCAENGSLSSVYISFAPDEK